MRTTNTADGEHHLVEDVEAELAAALPQTQGSRFFPLIRRWAYHVIPFILLAGAGWVLWREFRDVSVGDPSVVSLGGDKLGVLYTGMNRPPQ